MMIKPLRDLFLIQQEDAVRETKTASGILLLSTDNDRYQLGDGGQEAMLQDLIKKPKTNKGVVLVTGEKCGFIKKGDTVIYKKGSEICPVLDGEESRTLLSESSVLVKCVGDGYVPHPDYVLVVISKEARESLYNKKIKRNDGTEVLLFIGGDKGKEDADYNSVFVGTGEIEAVGSNIKNIKKGDTALLSYLCDNDEGIIVGYKNGNKIIAVKAVTTRHTERAMSYASRRPALDSKGKKVYKEGVLQTYNRDRIIFEKDDYEELSSLYGVVSGSDLIAIEPYCMLQHKETKIMKVGNSGVLFEEDEKIIERKVLAASEESKKRIGVENGDTIIADDFDLFNIEFAGKIISCVNDIDILGAATYF